MVLLLYLVIKLQMLMVVGGVSRIRLQEKQAAYQAELDELQKKMAAEQARAEELEEYEKYTQTQKYIEEVAKEKLGLVYEDEIIFKTEDH